MGTKMAKKEGGHCLSSMVDRVGLGKRDGETRSFETRKLKQRHEGHRGSIGGIEGGQREVVLVEHLQAKQVSKT